MQLCRSVVGIVLLHLLTQSLETSNTLAHHFTGNFSHQIRARVDSLQSPQTTTIITCSFLMQRDVRQLTVVVIVVSGMQLYVDIILYRAKSAASGSIRWWCLFFLLWVAHAPSACQR